MSECTGVSFFGLLTVLRVSHRLWLLCCGDYKQEGLHTGHAASAADYHQLSFPMFYLLCLWKKSVLMTIVVFGSVTFTTIPDKDTPVTT